jgi:predicted HicB family RNase H-like nuclease
VTPEVKAQAERAAREQGVSVSQLARAALERYLAS